MSTVDQFDEASCSIVHGLLLASTERNGSGAAALASRPAKPQSLLLGGVDSFTATSMLHLVAAGCAASAPVQRCEIATVSLEQLLRRCAAGTATSVVDALDQALAEASCSGSVVLLAGLGRLLWHCNDAGLASAPPEQLRLRQRVLLLVREGVDVFGGVIRAVVGTASADEEIDAAVRAAFDLELVLPMPTPTQRAATFRACIDSVAHSKRAQPRVDTALRSAAACASLAALCRAYTFADVVSSLNRACAMAIADGGALDAATVRRGIAAHSPLLLSSNDAVEWIVDAPNVPWSSVGGMREVKRALEEMVVWPHEHPDAFARLGIEAPRSILLYGAPGTGKTLLAKAVATRSKARFLAVSVPSIVKSNVGGGVRALKRFFTIAEQSAPCIIFFDEIEALFGSRETSSAHERRLMAQMLVSIDALSSQREAHRRVVLIAATNCPWQLDAALLQRGRFARVVYVPPPVAEGRSEILALQRKRMCWAADVDLHELTERTEHFTGAEVVNLCQTAALDALRERAGASCDSAPPEVARAHFLAALRHHFSAHSPVDFARFGAWRPVGR